MFGKSILHILFLISDHFATNTLIIRLLNISFEYFPSCIPNLAVKDMIWGHQEVIDAFCSLVKSLNDTV